MDYRLLVAYAVFFFVPFLFWAVIRVFPQRSGARTWSAVVTGGDGRLSLSRIQAFVWTLLILGSFCAAMVMHPWVDIVDQPEIERRKTAWDAAKAKHDAAIAAVAAAETDLASKSSELETEQELLADANEESKKAATDEEKKAAAEAVKARENGVKAASLAVRKAQRVLENAGKAEGTAKTKHETAKESYRKTQWVKIPMELLALAGISLATGVFAAAISAGGDTGAAPVVSSVISTQAPAPLPAGWPATRASFLTIVGSGFGTSGEVRLNGRYVRALAWTDTGIIVDADPTPAPNYRTLTVDTPNGKTSHGFIAPLQLGEPIVLHESRDLFREDNNPRIFSVTKFQMFAWTIVAVVFYCAILLVNLDRNIDSLPVVDATLVMLTGLSAGGYLGGKAASNMAPPK